MRNIRAKASKAKTHCDKGAEDLDRVDSWYPAAVWLGFLESRVPCPADGESWHVNAREADVVSTADVFGDESVAAMRALSTGFLRQFTMLTVHQSLLDTGKNQAEAHGIPFLLRAYC